MIVVVAAAAAEIIEIVDHCVYYNKIYYNAIAGCAY